MVADTHAVCIGSGSREVRACVFLFSAFLLCQYLLLNGDHDNYCPLAFGGHRNMFSGIN